MFLISKIVRGRRLLHELEKQEKEESSADHLQAPRRNQVRHRRSSPVLIINNSDSPDDGQPRPSRRSTMRQKTESGDTLEIEKMQLRRTSSMPSLCEALPSTSRRIYDYDSKLNKLQKKALRFTWARLQTRNGGKRVDSVFEEVFDRLVRQLPQIREMFNTRAFLCAISRNDTASLRDHAKMTVRMVDKAIRNLEVERDKRTDTGSEQDPFQIGGSHGCLRFYGMTGNYWEKWGECFIDIVLSQEPVRDLPGAAQAWVIFTACLVDQMRAGFELNKQQPQQMVRQNAVNPQVAQTLTVDERGMGEEFRVSNGEVLQGEQERFNLPENMRLYADIV